MIDVRWIECKNPKCFYVWKKRKDYPKACPECKTRLNYTEDNLKRFCCKNCNIIIESLQKPKSCPTEKCKNGEHWIEE